jgi:formylglycine-generating enzyme required for sulfatase activity
MALVQLDDSSAVCVDKWEGSLVDENGQTFSPHEPPNGKSVKAVSKPGVVPQAHVSMLEAQRACANAGKRLCHRDEWVAACKGPNKTRYPYGDERVANACVDTNRTAPLPLFYSQSEMYTSRAMNDPRLNQQPNTVAKTGEASACTNAYGVHDMVGNVHEWVDDGTFHGGYYLDTKINREGCDYVTTAHDAAYYDYSTGFRCCLDPQNDKPAAIPPKLAEWIAEVTGGRRVAAR